MPKPQGWEAPSREETLPVPVQPREITPLAATNLTAPTVVPGTGLNVLALGELMARSGFFADAREAAQACVKIMAGQELGIAPVAAMTAFYIIQGRPALSANLMAALVKRSGRYDYRVELLTNEECRLAFYERGEKVGTSSFTMEDARVSGKAGGQNWKTFPRNMLFARALSNGVRWFCPDLTIAPIYTPDELGVPEIVEADPLIDAE